MSLFILFILNYWDVGFRSARSDGNNRMGVWETTMQEVHVFSGITGTTRRFRLSAGPSLYLQMCFKQTGSNWSPTGGNQIRLCRLVFRGGIIIFDFFFFPLLQRRAPLSRGPITLMLCFDFLPLSFFFFFLRRGSAGVEEQWLPFQRSYNLLLPGDAATTVPRP